MKIKITSYYLGMFIHTEKLSALINLSNYLKIYANEDVFPVIKFYLDGRKIHIETETKENIINRDKR
jgi:surface polysaccharide O-acyltransferase-like enzyme